MWKKVQVFLGGDYHFLDDMGHQGSSASYPSCTGKVLLSHLQNHGNRPHTPLDCPVEKRTINSYVEDYNANLADCRNNKNLHENGKYHHSVVGPMMFPLKDIDQVVPATLHIMLGVVLMMYNLLLKECKRIDEESDGEILLKEKEEINGKWEALSLELLNVELNLRQHVVNTSTMINRMNRFEAVVKRGPSGKYTFGNE